MYPQSVTHRARLFYFDIAISCTRIKKVKTPSHLWQQLLACFLSVEVSSVLVLHLSTNIRFQLLLWSLSFYNKRKQLIKKQVID